MLRTLLAALILVPAPALAFDMPQDEDAAQFVASNVVSTFYHELAHALIDILELPVLGKEEDAADTLSAVLTNHIWTEDSATQIVYDTANAFSISSAEYDAEGYEQPWADSHSLDIQRYYGLVCLFYGADPEHREEIASDLELPDDRKEGCEYEYWQAESGWEKLLDGLDPVPGKTHGLKLDVKDPDDPIAQILQEEITTLNELYGLPVDVPVRIEKCDEANAFYDPDSRSILMCEEYAPDMVRLWTYGQNM